MISTSCLVIVDHFCHKMADRSRLPLPSIFPQPSKEDVVNGVCGSSICLQHLSSFHFREKPRVFGRPGFVTKHFTRQATMESVTAVWKDPGYYFLKFLADVLITVFYSQIEVEGKQNIPKDGPVCTQKSLFSISINVSRECSSFCISSYCTIINLTSLPSLSKYTKSISKYYRSYFVVPTRMH